LISSFHNPRIRWIRTLVEEPKARRREGLWVGEGVRLAEEILREGLRVQLWVLARGWGEGDSRDAEIRRIIETERQEVLEVSGSLLREVADTRSPQGVLCVFDAPRWTLESALAGPGPALVLDGLQDPGNLGTLARSAEAAGAAGLLLAPGSVDPGNPKALRASAGSLLRLPWVVAEDAVTVLQGSGRMLTATAGHGGEPYDRADLVRPFALLIGQEAGGLSSGLRDAAVRILTIPMAGRTESLNAATAAAVILFEAARQRRGRR
jgi:TrmH family RNA methyltransferase